ncbi:hypothetical protein HDU76_008393 [Blyttiomyces sp. JEL0837]|nr:hypothetical protein HDU76_008393 [Blyttiomyces sp. JEL0837]
MQIPSLNKTHHSRLPNKSLTKFRGMIQDNGFSPQYYLSKINLRHEKTGAKKAVSLRYCDECDFDTVGSCDDGESVGAEGPGWVVDDDTGSMRSVMCYAQKVPVLCVSVPGEQGWGVGVDAGGVGGDGGEMEGNVEKLAGELQVGLKIDDVTPSVRNKLPHDNKDAVVVVVKIYGEEPEDLSLNDIVDFVGVLEYVQPHDRKTTEEDPMEYLSDEMSEFRNLPMLHCVFYDKVKPYAHPLVLDLEASRSLVASAGFAQVTAMALDYFSSFLLGDMLASEYLLCTLISKIRTRIDSIPTGFLPLNLCRAPRDREFGVALFNAIGNLVPRARRIPMSLEFLNTRRVCPGFSVVRDTSNPEGQQQQGASASSSSSSDEHVMVSTATVGLSEGALQVPDGTVVLIDEVEMTAGKLNETGVGNLQHLSHLISHSEISYAFGVGESQQVTKADVDLGVLVLSEGKCMFQMENVLPIQPGSSNGWAGGAADLDLIRTFIGVLRVNEEYSVSDEMQDVVKDFFVSARKDSKASNGNNIYSQEALALRLEIARCVSLFGGNRGLTMEAWVRSGEMEEVRMKRVQELPVRKDGAAGSGAAGAARGSGNGNTGGGMVGSVNSGDMDVEIEVEVEGAGQSRRDAPSR